MPRLNRSQRVVAVVAMGAIVVLVGGFLTSPAGPPFTGWVGYAPLANHSSFLALSPFARDGLTPGANAGVCIGLVLGWMVASMLVLRAGRPRGSASGDGQDLPGLQRTAEPDQADESS